MSPFVLFRMWLRRAPLANRVAAALASVVTLALLVWIAVPAPDHQSGNVATSGGGFSPVAEGAQAGSQAGPTGSAAGASTGSATAGAAGAPGAGAAGTGAGAPTAGSSGAGATATAAAGTGAAAPTAGSSATGPAGSGGTSPAAAGNHPGTASGPCSGPLTPLKIGVVIPDVGSGAASLNSTFGIPPASQEQADYQAVFDAIDKAGGVDCHSLVGDYAVFNETDANSAQTECLQFVQDKVFAVLGGWEPSTTDTCALQNKLPTFADIEIPEAEVKQFYPYYFSNSGELDLIFHNFAFALSKMGYLSASKGFKKVGVFYRDCIPGLYQSMTAQLERAGVPASGITDYDVGCPSTPFAPQSTIEAAILKFQQAGVTDVVPMQEYEDLQNFTRQANAQGYKPQYLVADDGVVATSSSPTFSPDPNNFDGAVAITPYQYGAIQSGLPEDATTKRCDQIMTSHGLPTVYNSGDQVAGVACSLVWMLQAALQHDTNLSQTGLAAGLQAAGSVAFPYPDGPNDFRQSGGSYGGEEWRPLQFQSGCSCWKVTDPNFSPSFS